MGRIKTKFSQYIKEDKTYELGDQWSKDFDYDGMIDRLLNIKKTDSVEDLRKLEDSLTDVNYHTEARILIKVIEAIEEGNLEMAEDRIKQIKNIYEQDFIGESLEGGIKALPVNVYRSGLSDSTANGLTKYKDSLMFLFDNLQSPFETKEGEDYLVLVNKKIMGREISYAVPKSILDEGIHSMFGGNFIYTSDSRFPFDHPIKVHDRVERR